ncbi:Voltage-gated ion channel, partial [Globisporangium splendens]
MQPRRDAPSDGYTFRPFHTVSCSSFAFTDFALPHSPPLWFVSPSIAMRERRKDARVEEEDWTKKRWSITASGGAAASQAVRFVRERSRHVVRKTTGISGSRLSRILLGNDSWEDFEGIPKHFSFRARVCMKLKFSSLGVAWELFQTAFALVVSVLYVAQTYYPTIDTDDFDLAALVVFSSDYLLHLYCCDNRLKFVFNFMSLMDVLTIVPAIVDRVNRHNGQNGLPFLRFLRILRLLRLIRLLRAAGSRSISVYQPVMGNPHILIVGHLSEPHCLLDFFRELYHPDRMLANGVVNSLNDLPSVIVGPDEPNEGTINLLDHPMLQNRVAYIKGSVMSEEDFTDAEKTDQETVLRLLAVRNYNPDMEIYTQIQPHDHETINLRFARRSEADVIIDDASSVMDGGEEICNHIIVVSDLDHVSIEAFARMLRLERHVKGSEDHHPIIFLSWSTKSPVIAARVLQVFADVYLMLATHDSKTELLRANILTAKSCVLLADKTAIQQPDGEVIDGKTISHCLAILSIQEEYGIDVMSEFMPLVELTIPRTMKILDMEMKKRFKASMLRQQELDQLQFVAASSDNAKDDLVKVVEAEDDRQHHKIKRAGKNIVKNMYQQGAENISTIETHIKLQQRIQYHRSMIHRQQALIEKAYFESGGTSVLPFSQLGLIRFIYELLFSENGQPFTKEGGARAHNHHGSKSQQGSHENRDPDDTKVASSLVQIHVPIAFVGSTFGAMFAHLITKEDIVAIGLYRRRGTQYTLPYVAAGPATDTILVSDDMIFALAQPEALKREQASRARAMEQQHHVNHSIPVPEPQSNTS